MVALHSSRHDNIGSSCAQCVAYIGGDEAYQRYRRLALQQSMIEKEREARYASYIDHIDQVESINH